MISLLFPRTPLCTAAIVVYTCLCVPFEKVKRAVYGEEREWCCKTTMPCLRVAMFREIIEMEKKSSEDLCSICLVEFEAEDAVTRLVLCSHLFHLQCIETWLLRDRLTCPLCRSFVFSSSFSLSSSSSLPVSVLWLLALSAFCLSLFLLSFFILPLW